MRSCRWTGLIPCALVVLGCRGGAVHEVPDAFRWDDDLPAGATIHVRDRNGTIQVHPGAGAHAEVDASKRWTRGREKDVQFLSTRVGNDVYVCAIWGTRGQCDEHGYRSRRASLLVRLLTFRLGGGDMATNFVVTLPAGVRIDASTVNGGIDVAGATAGTVARTVNGTVQARGVSGPITAISVNGNVQASVDSLIGAEPLRFETVNGSVRAVLPAGLEGRVELATVNGRIRTDFPVTITGGTSSRRVSGTIGAGQRSVRLRSVNGSVELVRAAARNPGT
jgi:hypothetical protein